ncbi:MAG: hypothetical protein NC122_07065 [Faecalibacterium sp.]|nr:hypothetical protein [Ruminococcus sp.]MCM1392261.1 hypothetical protein [Ruminococcus sp.]MCM1485951.1 hypothetical protein [Faecalibacterium sp.]
MAEKAVKKLKRSALLHYLDTLYNTESATYEWYLIGKDVEDLSVNLNPSTTTVKNILDETNVNDEGYEPSMDIDTYYADPSDGAFYEKIKDITMNRLTGDDCKTRLLEVLVDRTSAPFDAWIEDVIIKPSNYGGAQGGVRIPYNVAFCGNRRKVSVTITDKVPTITTTASK